LEDELSGYQASLARLQQQPDPARPDARTVRELLATFPVNGVELRKLGQTDLRELLASLNPGFRSKWAHEALTRENVSSW
jgi:hypothetical protein